MIPAHREDLVRLTEIDDHVKVNPDEATNWIHLATLVIWMLDRRVRDLERRLDNV